MDNERKDVSSAPKDLSRDAGVGGKPNIPALMAEIRAQVKQVLKENPVDDTLQPKLDVTSELHKAGELLHSEELRYLNRNHAFSLQQFDAGRVKSHRPGLIGKIIVKCKRKILTFIWEAFLRDYVNAEKDFNASLVRYLNHVSKYVDARDSSIFWELIRKLDYDIQKTSDRLERIASDQSGGLEMARREVLDTLNIRLREMQVELSKLQAGQAGQGARVDTLEAIAAGLEKIVGKLGTGPSYGSAAVPAALKVEDSRRDGGAPGIPNYSYLLFENRYRGSEELIKSRLTDYVDLFRNASAPVLEIGAARGELLELFRDAGITARGVDLDAAMVEHAKEKGLDVAVANGIEYLATQSDRSLGGVIATQVVEHLTQPELRELINQCLKKVKSGGLVVFETINSESIVALCHHYFRDPTHVAPLHPETLRFSMELLGLRVREVRPRSPFPPDGQLKTIARESFMTPRWEGLLERINFNFDRLNQLLFGHQDYCIIAEVP